MTHDDIEANDLTSQYVAGRLTDGAEREFEAHLVDCQRCLDAVESEMSLHEGLRFVGAESVATPAPSARRPTPSGIRAYPVLQLAAAVLLAVSASLGVWLLRSTTELSEARSERDGLQRRTRQAEQLARGLQQKLADAPTSSKEVPAAPAAAKVVPATVFALATVRGSSSGDGGPVNRVRIDRDTQLVVLSVEIPASTGSASYTVALKDQAARLLWTAGSFSPSSDSLSVAVDPTLLKAGDYILEISDRSAGSGERLVGRYPFRVVVR